MAEMLIGLVVNMDQVTAQIERMAQHFEQAPDGDAAKEAMAAFGEIDVDKHFVGTTEFSDGTVTCTFCLCPELQAIADMVPA